MEKSVWATKFSQGKIIQIVLDSTIPTFDLITGLVSLQYRDKSGQCPVFPRFYHLSLEIRQFI